MVCGPGVAKRVLAAWHPEPGRSESPVAGAITAANWMFWEFEDGLTNTITGAAESAFRASCA
jgi:hypothetical protein